MIWITLRALVLSVGCVLLMSLFVGQAQPSASAVVTAQVVVSVTAPLLSTSTAVGTAVSTAVTPLPAETATRNPTAVFEEFKGGYPPGALMDPTNAAAATVAVQEYNNLLTRTALTPTITAGPTETDVPTATPGVGLITDSFCIRALHGGMPRFPSCWEARVNNQWILVGGGQFGGDSEAHLQSVILVCPGPCYRPDEGTIYPTPHNVLEARIANVSGTLVTVVARDPAIPDSFVFDLATAQWVAPPGASPYPVYATPPGETPTSVPTP